MDGNLAYNPSTGTVTATIFKGNIDAVDGDFDGTLEADAITIGGTAVGSIFSPIAGGTGILTTGALDAGSITSGFGTINNGASAITSTGVGSFGSLDISGNIDVDGTTNLDVVDIDGTLNVAGETTLQTHLNMGDDDTIKLGAGVDLTLASNGTHGTIATPNGILTVDAASTLILDSDAGNIQLKDGGNNFMTLSQTSSTVASINIPTSDGDLHIVGNDGGVAVTAMSFDMSAGGAATIANGLTLTDGNVVVANGHGIDFSATADATGMSSELLDDYEEGNYTVTFTCSSSGTITLKDANNQASFTKVGRLVHASGYIIVESVSSPAGFLRINLPFTPANLTDTSGFSAVSLYVNDINSANVADFVGYIPESDAQIYIQLGDAVSGQNDSANQFKANSALVFSASYHTT